MHDTRTEETEQCQRRAWRKEGTDLIGYCMDIMIWIILVISCQVCKKGLATRKTQRVKQGSGCVLTQCRRCHSFYYILSYINVLYVGEKTQPRHTPLKSSTASHASYIKAHYTAFPSHAKLPIWLLIAVWKTDIQSCETFLNARPFRLSPCSSFS